MSPETKQKALAKLATFTPKIGYPKKWRDYSALEIRRDDLVGNIERAAAFEWNRRLAKLGKPVDRDEWHMTPQTVNAYYNPSMNEIVFPAAILQPPFFNLAADDAVNYGGIGAVIGHETGHGFDDQGSKWDGAGNLDRLVDRRPTAPSSTSAAPPWPHSTIASSRLPGFKVNGRFTLGENIADLAGLTIAYAAYRRSLGGQEAPVHRRADGRSAILHRLGPGLAPQAPRRRPEESAARRPAFARPNTASTARSATCRRSTRRLR